MSVENADALLNIQLEHIGLCLGLYIRYQPPLSEQIFLLQEKHVLRQWLNLEHVLQKPPWSCMILRQISSMFN
jgi:hypothetical protein